MALSRAQVQERAKRTEKLLRVAWRTQGPRADVTAWVQTGRRRPRVQGRVAYVSTTGAYVLLDDGGDKPLHVPVDRVQRLDVSPALRLV